MKEHFENILKQIAELDPVLAPIVFILAYATATVVFIPGGLLTIGGGALFGLWKGTAIVSIASVTAACIAFVLGRTVARNWVVNKIGKSPKFKAIDEAIGREGGKIVFLLRLSPAFPFTLLNYLLGVTKVPFKSYLFASWIGMLPGTFLYVYLGHVAGGIANAAAGGEGKSPGEWAMLVVGILATVLVTVYVTKVARKALSQSVEDEAIEDKSTEPATAN